MTTDVSAKQPPTDAAPEKPSGSDKEQMQDPSTTNSNNQIVEAGSSATVATAAKSQVTSIKQKIIELNQGQDVNKAEYTNLILDDLPLQGISLEDKEYLEGFTECQYLSLNTTQLKSLENIPTLEKLERLDINDNFVAGGLQVLAERTKALKSLKIANNKINNMDELQHLKTMTNLLSLDLSGNPISKLPEGEQEEAKPAEKKEGEPSEPIDKEAEEQEKYRKKLLASEYYTKVRELLPQVEVLDRYNKSGEEVESDEDETEPEEDEEDDDEEDDMEPEDDDAADEVEDGGATAATDQVEKPDENGDAPQVPDQVQGDEKANEASKPAE